MSTLRGAKFYLNWQVSWICQPKRCWALAANYSTIWQNSLSLDADNLTGRHCSNRPLNACQRHRLPPDIVSYAVWPYCRINFSHVGIEAILAASYYCGSIGLTLKFFKGLLKPGVRLYTLCSPALLLILAPLAVVSG
jgi:hypothetical protein